MPAFVVPPKFPKTTNDLGLIYITLFLRSDLLSFQPENSKATFPAAHPEGSHLTLPLFGAAFAGTPLLHRLYLTRIFHQYLYYDTGQKSFVILACKYVSGADERNRTSTPCGTGS